MSKEERKKRSFGEKLFPKIQKIEPRLAGKITGMLLDLDNDELSVLLNDNKALTNKINEALSVLKDHQAQASESNKEFKHIPVHVQTDADDTKTDNATTTDDNEQHPDDHSNTSRVQNIAKSYNSYGHITSPGGWNNQFMEDLVCVD